MFHSGVFQPLKQWTKFNFIFAELYASWYVSIYFVYLYVWVPSARTHTHADIGLNALSNCFISFLHSFHWWVDCTIEWYKALHLIRMVLRFTLKHLLSRHICIFFLFLSNFFGWGWHICPEGAVLLIYFVFVNSICLVCQKYKLLSVTVTVHIQLIYFFTKAVHQFLHKVQLLAYSVELCTLWFVIDYSINILCQDHCFWAFCFFFCFLLFVLCCLLF